MGEKEKKLKKRIIKILGIVNIITYLVTIVFSVLSRVYDYEIIDKLWHAFFLISSVLLGIVSILKTKEEKLRRYIEEREKQDSINVFDEFKDDSNSITDDGNNYNQNEE